MGTGKYNKCKEKAKEKMINHYHILSLSMVGIFFVYQKEIEGDSDAPWGGGASQSSTRTLLGGVRFFELGQNMQKRSIKNEATDVQHGLQGSARAAYMQCHKLSKVSKGNTTLGSARYHWVKI
jgi:hypothetical protein